MAVIIQSMNPKEIYTERIKTLTDEICQLNRHNRLVVVLELTAIALAIGCIVAYTMWSSIVALVVAAMFVAAYVAIRWKDSSNSRLSEQKESIRSVYQKEVAYLNGDFSEFGLFRQNTCFSITVVHGALDVTILAATIEAI